MSHLVSLALALLMLVTVRSPTAQSLSKEAIACSDWLVFEHLCG